MWFQSRICQFYLGTFDSNSMLWTGNPGKMESNCLAEAQHENQTTVDGVSSFHSGFHQVDEANAVLPNALEKSCWEHPESNVDVMDFTKHDNK